MDLGYRFVCFLKLRGSGDDSAVGSIRSSFRFPCLAVFMLFSFVWFFPMAKDFIRLGYGF